MTSSPHAGQRFTWWQCEPRRFERDRREVGERFPSLAWDAQGAGQWLGRLPRWPFERPEPDGVPKLIGPGLDMVVRYGHAYPVVPPAIFPLDPEPLITERTEHRWHVMGDGSLCLMQADAMWSGRDSVVDLLLKAAAWRMEYALMKAGVIDGMTLHGIVEESCLDHLFGTAEAAGGDSAGTSHGEVA